MNILPIFYILLIGLFIFSGCGIQLDEENLNSIEKEELINSTQFKNNNQTLENINLKENISVFSYILSDSLNFENDIYSKNLEIRGLIDNSYKKDNFSGVYLFNNGKIISEFELIFFVINSSKKVKIDIFMEKVNYGEYSFKINNQPFELKEYNYSSNKYSIIINKKFINSLENNFLKFKLYEENKKVGLSEIKIYSFTDKFENKIIEKNKSFILLNEVDLIEDNLSYNQKREGLYQFDSSINSENKNLILISSNDYSYSKVNLDFYVPDKVTEIMFKGKYLCEDSSLLNKVKFNSKVPENINQLFIFNNTNFEFRIKEKNIVINDTLNIEFYLNKLNSCKNGLKIDNLQIFILSNESNLIKHDSKNFFKEQFLLTENIDNYILVDHMDFAEDMISHNFYGEGLSGGAYALEKNNSLRAGGCGSHDGFFQWEFYVPSNTEILVLRNMFTVAHRPIIEINGINLKNLNYSMGSKLIPIKENSNLKTSKVSSEDISIYNIEEFVDNNKIKIKYSDSKKDSCDGDIQIAYSQLYALGNDIEIDLEKKEKISDEKNKDSLKEIHDNLCKNIIYNNINILENNIEIANSNINDRCFDKYRLLEKVILNSKSYELAEILLKNGADADLKNKYLDSKYPILLASKENDFDLVELLIENGADVNVQDSLGANPLSYAIINENEDLIELFLNEGINPDSKVFFDDESYPIHIALKNKHNNKIILGLLETNKININRINEDLVYSILFLSLNIDLSDNNWHTKNLDYDEKIVDKIIKLGANTSRFSYSDYSNDIIIDKLIENNNSILLQKLKLN